MNNEVGRLCEKVARTLSGAAKAVYNLIGSYGSRYC